MSKNIDENVVKISFDNRNFESNVKTTMSTLDRFKKALSFKSASKGLDELSTSAKKVDLSVISKGAEETQVKFSALQVVGTTVLANLTTSAMQAASALKTVLTSSLIQGGITRAMNIEQARFQLEGLGYEGERLTQIMSDAEYAVKGTAYGLDVASKAASQLAASDIQAGDSMRYALRGISGVAAMTNSTYEDISRIFTGIAGQNRVMGNDLLQLSGRGLNAAATLGKALGKTEAEVRQMVSKGEIDFATFAKAMDDAFGSQATKANATFSGALSNMRAALSRIGADVASPALENLRDIFNALRVAIDATHDDLRPFIAQINELQTALSKSLVEFIDLGGLKAFIDGIGNIFMALWSVIKPIKQGFENIFPTPSVKQVVEMAEHFRDLTSKLILTDEAAQSIRDTFTKVADLIKRFTDALKWGSSGVKNFLTETHILSNSVNSVSNAILDFVLGVTNGIDVTDNLTGVVDGLGAGFEGVGRVLTLVSTAIGILTSAFSNSITYINQGIANLTGGVGTGVNGIVEIIFNVLELIPKGIARIIRAVADGVREILSAIPISEINAAAQNTLFTLVLAQIVKFMNGINAVKKNTIDFVGSIEGVIKGVSGVLDGVKGSLQSFSTSIKTNALVKIAASVAILAFSLKMLSDIPIDKLGASLGILAGGLIIMGGAVVAMSAIMAKVNKGAKGFLGLNDSITQLIKVSAAMLLFAHAIKILSESLDILSGMSWGDIIKGLTAIGGMAAVLIAISKLMDKTKGIVKTSASLIIFSYAIKMMADSFKQFEGVTWTEVAQGLISIGGAMGILVAGMKLLGKNTKGVIKVSASMVILAIALQELSKGVAGFEDVKVSSIVKAGVAMAALDALLYAVSKIKVNILNVIGQIALMMVAVKSMGEIVNIVKSYDDVSPESVGKFSAAVLTFFGAIKLFVASLGKKDLGRFLEISGGMWGIAEGLKTFANATKMFGEMSTEEIAKGLVSIVVGLKTMVMVLSSTPEKSIVQTSFAFVVLAVAINALSKSILAFGSSDFPSLVKGLTAFTATLGILVVAMKGLTKNSVKTIQGASAMLIMAIAISALVGPIKTLSNIDTHDIAKGLASLSISLAIVGIAAKTLGSMGGKILKTAGSLAVMGASLIVFGLGLTAIIYPIKSLGGMDQSQITSGVVGLGAVIMSLFALTNTMNSLPSISVKTIAKLAVLSVVIAGIGAVLGQLAMTNATAALEASIAISAVMLSAGGTLTLLSLVPLTGAIKAIAAMAVVIAGMSAIVAAMGALAQIPGAKWLMNEGAEFLKMIGEAIGSFFGGIVGGIAGGALAGIGAALPTFGAQLSSFAIAASPFFTAMNNINSEALNGTKALAEMILILTAASVLESLTSWFTGGVDFAKLALDLIPFGLAMQQYAATVKGLDAETIINSANAGKALAELVNNLPETGGLMQKLMGEHSLVDFTKQLVPFGAALNSYSMAIADLNPDAVTNSATAAKTLTELINNLPETGGFMQDIMGEHNFSEFIQNLIPFGEAICEYSNIVSGVNAEAIIGSANAGKALAELINALPETGGLLQDITGVHDLVAFTEELAPFGLAMMMYSMAVSGINADAITSSATAGKALAELVTNLPETGGLVQKFTGEHGFTTLVNQLAPFGLAMKMYSLAISGIDPAAIQASAVAGQALVGLVESFPKEGGWANVEATFGGKASVTGLVRNLVPFGLGMKAYSLAIAGLDSAAVEASANAGKALAELADALPKEGGLLQEVMGSAGNMATFALNLIPFGVAMRDYAGTITGIDSAAVEASAIAGKALAELANALPTEGGLFNDLKNVFMGESDITSFVYDLIPFGVAMRDYAGTITGIDSSAVEASANAGKALAGLAEALPKEGGLFAGLDATTVSFSAFGNELANFGPYYASFYNSVKGIEADVITSSAEAINKILEICNNIINSEGDYTKILTFGGSLPSLASNFVDYSSKISNISPEIVTQVTNALNSVIDLCKQIPEQVNASPLNDFVTALQNAANDGISGFADSIYGGTDRVSQAITDLGNTITSSVDVLKSGTAITSFKDLGELSDTEYGNGIRNRTDAAERAISYLVQICVKKLGDESWRFEKAGENDAYGYARGMTNNNATNAVKDAAYRMAKTAMDKVKETTDQASPSKEYMRIARYDVLGYAKGYDKYGYLAEDSASSMAMSMLMALKNSIDIASSMAEEDLVFSPTITPVIDLSKAKKEAAVCNNLMSGISTSINSSRMMAATSIPNQNGIGNSNVVTNNSSSVVNFTQNNYSPKALSRIDIYRDTRNQLSRLKGVNGA